MQIKNQSAKPEKHEETMSILTYGKEGSGHEGKRRPTLGEKETEQPMWGGVCGTARLPVGNGGRNKSHLRLLKQLRPHDGGMLLRSMHNVGWTDSSNFSR